MPRKDNRLKSNPRFPGLGLLALASSRSEYIETVTKQTCEAFNPLQLRDSGRFSLRFPCRLDS
jgi:hypothetical protein